jgi:DNA-binding CsgD family transcriptional regulator
MPTNQRRKRGRPRGTFGPHRAECLRRFDGGATVVEIARALGISQQAVSAHLRDSGRDPAGRDSRSRQSGRERFADLWNAAPDLGAAARALGLTESQAVRKAVWLRAAGLALKRMPARRGPQTPRAAPVAARVLALHRRGRNRAQILRRTGANPGYVSQLLGGSYLPKCLK